MHSPDCLHTLQPCEYAGGLFVTHPVPLQYLHSPDPLQSSHFSLGAIPHSNSSRRTQPRQTGPTPIDKPVRQEHESIFAHFRCIVVAMACAFVTAKLEPRATPARFHPVGLQAAQVAAKTSQQRPWCGTWCELSPNRDLQDHGARPDRHIAPGRWPDPSKAGHF